jgi:hypothetical protein
MQAPVQLDSVNVSTERVRQLYEAMPAVFARDIARAKGQPIPPQPTPTLKRERPGDESDVIMKRRDTGESKIGMGMPPPATPSLPPKSISAPVQPFAGVGVAQQGATPDRTRMLQMRQQQQAQFQSQTPQVQQSQVPAGQQRSPPPGSGAAITIGAGVGSGQGQNQAPAMHPSIMQHVVSTYGPQGLAFIQHLHDPNSHFVKYMVEQIPNFMSLPLPQQLKHMRDTQVRLWLVVFLRTLTCTLLIANDAETSATPTPTITTTTTAAAAAEAAVTTAAAATTTTTTTTAAAAAATTATAAAQLATVSPTTTTEHRQSLPRRARGPHAITTSNGGPVAKYSSSRRY